MSLHLLNLSPSPSVILEVTTKEDNSESLAITFPEIIEFH